MLQLTRTERLLDYPGLTNTRDLGGYETRDGFYTKAHRFIRATNPTSLSDETLNALYNYGVRIVVDLRSGYEKESQPNQLKDYRDIKYIEANLLSGDDTVVIAEEIKDYQSLGGFYMYMIESNKPMFKKVFTIFSENLHEGILFNCSAGKDRTGVVAALLLDLAGCYDYDIIKDYSESYQNNEAIIKELEKIVPKERHAFLGSEPRNMMEFLAYLHEHYGSAKGYLLDCGLSELQINDIVESFGY